MSDCDFMKSLTVEEICQERPDLVAQIQSEAVARANAKPATFEELAEVFGNSSDAGKAFVYEALTANMSLTQAVDRWTRKMEAQNADTKSRLAALEMQQKGAARGRLRQV